LHLHYLIFDLFRNMGSMLFLKLLVAVLGYCFGIFFFSRGFLLTRYALLHKSSCYDVQYPVSSSSPSGCWVKSKYKRAILLVVDALRYDFVASPKHSKKIYHNKFSLVNELLSKKPSNSMLFKFIADPPTTTLQRLKSLTTGSLPTFVDAGTNFAGTAIEEDNLIDQMINQGRKITFMGDDTWMALFPNHFNKSYPYPSFDVKDLHTVDDGILAHLYDELRSNSWDLLIAHFLGVDHCGHKYGPNHPEMAKKLHQMDIVIRNVTKMMPDDTILFVFGDHGMTQNGDHGGDSEEELSAALFAYSSQRLHLEKENVQRVAAQLNLVPTLALLLDIPVPFSNLGALIPELFLDKEDRTQAARVNVYQVIRYTETYLRNFHDSVLTERFSSLLKIFNNLEADELTAEKSLDIVHKVNTIFLDSWAKFHLGWMTLGIVTILETIVSSLVIVRFPDRAESGRLLFLKCLHFALFFWAVLARNESIPPVIGITLSIELTMHLHCLVGKLFTAVDSIRTMDLISLFFMFLHAFSVFSNSYIVNEDAVVRYIIQAFFIIFFISTVRKYLAKQCGLHRFNCKTRKLSLFEWSKKNDYLNLTIFVTTGMLIIRCGVWYRRCREELVKCTMSLFLLPFGSLLDRNDKIIRMLVSCISVWIIYIIPKRYLQDNGHLDSDSRLLVLVCKFCSKLISWSLMAGWAYSWLAEEVPKMMENSLPLFFPRCCYAGFVFFFIFYIFDPLFTYTNVVDRGAKLVSVNVHFPIHSLHAYVKENWKTFMTNGPTNQGKLVFVHGLKTALSGSLVAFIWNFTLILTLLLGDGASFSMVCLLLISAILLRLNKEEHSILPVIIFMVELCFHFFYAFGHQPTFAAIPWDAAFVGVPGNFKYLWLQSLLVMLNISASFVFVVLFLPMVVFTRDEHSFAMQVATSYAQGRNCSMRIFTCNVLFLTVLGTKLFFCVLACALHRRHLMVWKIFAPKFIFETGLFFVTSVFMLIQFILVLRLQSRFCFFLQANKHYFSHNND
ncbi:GPI ethanolamine phosphate transferase 3, partial [Trichinella pseudospiralis]